MVRYAPRPDITRLRQARGENAAQFGVHFGRSGRTIEDWEQGRSQPDKLCERQLATFQADLKADLEQRTA